MLRVLLQYLIPVVLSSPVSCAHEEPLEPPLYEDLLFAELDQDKPKPKVDFPFDDLLIEDEVEEEGNGSRVRLERPLDQGFSAFLERGGTHATGKANKGGLRDGRKLAKEGKGYRRKNDKAALGTDETVAIMLWVCARMVELYPGTVPLVVGDISKEGGGRLRPHASHQNGRDVDLGYYMADNKPLRRFVDASPETMDVEKTWTLIELLLSTHKVEYLFIDRKLHQALYDEARSRFWAEEELQKLFEAPVGAAKKRGIIRHTKGHLNHIHVRFACPEKDEECH